MHVVPENPVRVQINLRTTGLRGVNGYVQQALDTVRVIGNESVHPGQMDLRDDVKTAQTLFELVNFIIDQRITQPNRIKTIYESLPKSKLDAIEGRDK